MTPLLAVEDLTVAFAGRTATVPAVNGVSFSVNAGERVGIVGESGAGKSVTALAMMDLLPSPPAVIGGTVRLDGVDVMSLSGRERNRLRGSRIAMIFQDPVGCLNPTMTVGDQIIEVIRAHESVSRRVARTRTIDLLGEVGIPAPSRRVDEFPHRFSGGMAQRVMIAIALAGRPSLVIADEPTTALDVTIAAQIVELLIQRCKDHDAAVVLITHDLALLAGFADRVLVMYGGRIIEQGAVDEIYYRPAHPYTWGLLAAVTRPGASHDRRQDRRLLTIPGAPPSGANLPPGCVFHPRCAHVAQECRTDQPRLEVHQGVGHRAACHFAGALQRPGTRGRDGE